MNSTDEIILPRAFLRQCRRRRWSTKIVDSTGVKLTGGTLLMRTLVLRRLLLREVLGPDDRCVGVMLPPSAGAVMVNAALSLVGRVPVNLNYTVTPEILNYCLEQAGIRQVLTSRRVHEKFPFKFNAKVVYVEELRDHVRKWDLVQAAFSAYVQPLALLERKLGLLKIGLDDLLTVVFTSGSTGNPKGVMLSYRNIGSNVSAINQIIRLNSRDVLAGVLPFFHSFGFTVTLWTVLGLDVGGVYHFSPLDGKILGKLCREQHATILLTTPTFLRGYLRRCSKEDFASLEVVVVGAEKMPRDLADQFESQFGFRPIEGYGTTELSPLVSANIPSERSAFGDERDRCEGSVGKPIPKVQARIVDPQAGHELPCGTDGMLQIRGPNVMQGYLNQPELTAKVVRDGWYTTGDIAHLDSQGFIHITGRLSRFSKIGGEMVPHGVVEEAIQALLPVSDEGALAVGVTAVPDEKRGERLIVLHTPLAVPAAEICRKLAEKGLPNLWIPAADSFLLVDAVPVLGTGKLDLRGLNQLARERLGLPS